MAANDKHNRGWEYLLWAMLMTAPVMLAVVGVYFTPRVPSKVPSNEVLFSQGTMVISYQPYLRREDGSTYRLVCPDYGSSDKNRTDCFDERIWKLKRIEVNVRHGFPTKIGTSRIVICDVSDLQGHTLLRPKLGIRCN